MSIKIPINTAAPLVVENFFSALPPTRPLTLMAFGKQDAIPNAGVAAQSILKVGGQSLGYFNLGMGFLPDSIPSVYASEKGSGSHSGFDLAYPGAQINTWMPCISSFIAEDNRYSYTVDGAGAELVSANTNGRTVSAQLLDLRLFGDGSWIYSNTYAAYIAIFDGTLTPAQRQEFYGTGDVAGVPLFAKFDATVDWATTGGQILDVSGNARHITPPVGWVYSPDNPAVAPPIDYTIRKGSIATITHTLTAGGITYATLDGQVLTLGTQSGQTVEVEFTDTITASGVYTLRLGDGVTPQDFGVQYNVIGLTTNTIQKEGSSIGVQTDLEMDVLDATGATVLGNFTGLTTDATGVTGQTIVPAGAVDDPVRVSGYSATAGIGFAFKTTLGLL